MQADHTRPGTVGRERVRPAREALEAKVTLLEEWVLAQVIPSDTPQFKTVRDVQQWIDTSRGLTTWSSYSIAAPGGPNGDLRLRLDLALKALRQIREGAASTQKKPRRGREISQIQTAQERDRLAQQNVELLAERDALSSEVSRLRHLIKEKDSQYRELLAKFEKIAPFGRS